VRREDPVWGGNVWRGQRKREGRPLVRRVLFEKIRVHLIIPLPKVEAVEEEGVEQLGDSEGGGAWQTTRSGRSAKRNTSHLCQQSWTGFVIGLGGGLAKFPH